MRDATKADTEADSASAKTAQEQLFTKITRWLTNLTQYPGFSEWKGKQLVSTVLTARFPNFRIESLPDFHFDDNIESEIEIIQGYLKVISSLYAIRECEFYFRKYPFGGRNVSRESHVVTCCEIFLSRIFQFRERWIRQLKKIDRNIKPKNVPVGLLTKAFDEKFGHLKDERNRIHHEESYYDLQTKAVGLSDLFQNGTEDLAFLRVRNSEYLRIRRSWVKTVRDSSDILDVFLGALATIMLEKCKFLNEFNGSSSTDNALS